MLRWDTGMKRRHIEDFIGWYGTVAILSAYALLSFGVITSGQAVYQVLNLTGALGIVYISFKRKAYQPGVLNIIWAVIALGSIILLSFQL